MKIYMLVLFFVLLLSLFSIFSSLKLKKNYLTLSLSAFLMIGCLRYIVLYIYMFSESPKLLYDLKNIVLFSFISVCIVSYMLSCLINKGEIKKYEKAVILLMLTVYIFIIYKAPEGIISTDYGYKIYINNFWIYIIAIIQGLFALLMIYLSIKHILNNKNLIITLINIIFALGYVISIAEGIYLLNGKYFFNSSIISEAAILLGILISIKTLDNKL